MTASALVVLEGPNDYKVYAEANWDPDTEEIKGGTFKIDNVKEGNYTLKVYKLGYETKTLPVNVKGDTTNDVGVIKINTSEPFNQEDGVFFYSMNTRLEPYDDEVVRKALNYALDKEGLVNYIQNHPDYTIQGRANRIITPLTRGYTTEDINYSYDPDKAQTILNEAGYSAGEIDITIHIPSSNFSREVVREVRSDWEALSCFNVQIKEHSWSEIADGYGDISLYQSGWIIDNSDPIFMLQSLEDYRMLEYDEEEKQLLEQAKMNSDNKEKALDYIYQLEEKIMEEAKLILMFYYPPEDRDY